MLVGKMSLCQKRRISADWFGMSELSKDAVFVETDVVKQFGRVKRINV